MKASDFFVFSIIAGFQHLKKKKVRLFLELGAVTDFCWKATVHTGVMSLGLSVQNSISRRQGTPTNYVLGNKEMIPFEYLSPQPLQQQFKSGNCFPCFLCLSFCNTNCNCIGNSWDLLWRWKLLRTWDFPLSNQLLSRFFDLTMWWLCSIGITVALYHFEIQFVLKQNNHLFF